MTGSIACVVTDCDRRANGSRGWCTAHYQYWYRTGTDPESRRTRLSAKDAERVIEQSLVVTNYDELAHSLGVTTHQLAYFLKKHPDHGDRVRTQLAVNRRNQTATRKEKPCGRCRRVLPITKFRNESRTPDGKGYLCKECNRDQAREYYESLSPTEEPVASESNCPACHRLLPADAFWRASRLANGLQTYCKSCYYRLADGESVEDIARDQGIVHRRSRRDFEFAS